jgi:hypothetical protein
MGTMPINNVDESSPAALLQMTAACWLSQAVYVAAKFGIADLLRDGPKSCDALAEATQTNSGALCRVLRALASVKVFAQEEDGRFRLTPLAQHLRTDVPTSVSAFAVMLGEPEHWHAWEGLVYSVKTGGSAFEHVFGLPHFKYFAQHEKAGRIFNAGMTSRSVLENDAIVAAYDFSDVQTVIDIGAGEGTLVTALLKAQPNLHAVIVDLPHVIAASRTQIEAKIQERCKFVAGDFFDSIPAGGDIYILKKVIHDWDDERARQILKNCQRAMPGNSRVLLAEPVIPSGNEPSFNKLLDLLILVWTSGGRERTESEHRLLLESAGLKLNRVIPTTSGLSILEAVPA